MDTSTGIIAFVPKMDGVPSSTIDEVVAFTKKSDIIVKTVVVENSDVFSFSYFAELLRMIEQKEGENYRFVLVLDPRIRHTDPDRVYEAFQRMMISGDADGIVGVSKTTQDSTSDIAVGDEGWMIPWKESKRRFCVNGELYLWRANFIREAPSDWRKQGRHILYEVNG